VPLYLVWFKTIYLTGMQFSCTIFLPLRNERLKKCNIIVICVYKNRIKSKIIRLLVIFERTPIPWYLVQGYDARANIVAVVSGTPEMVRDAQYCRNQQLDRQKQTSRRTDLPYS
jgi:hypothetical protein